MERLIKSILEMVKNKKMDKEIAISLIEELKGSFKQMAIKAAEPKMQTDDNCFNGKIAVIGMAVRFPMATSPEMYWQNLIEGRDCITEFPSERYPVHMFYNPDGVKPGMSYSKWGGFIDDVDKFAASFFKISPEEAKSIDPQQRIFLEIALETFHRAGYSKKSIWGSRTAVIVGARAGTYNTSESESGLNYAPVVTGNITNFIAARVSDFFNLSGPSYTVDTACSSSLVAIHNACKLLTDRECDMAIAGGIELKISPVPYATLSNSRALSASGKSYTFDKRADGFVPGEGGGAVLLKSLKNAIEDGDTVYAVISGSHVNNDGHTMGITTPNFDGQKNVIRDAYKKAGINPETLSCIEAHGTGTTIGDPIEMKALTEVFREYTDKVGYCAIGSVKTNIGHLDTAAGIASLIKIVLALYNKKIPPTLNCDMPNPRLNFITSPFYPNLSMSEWEPIQGVRRAAISSFGFGGTNCHIVLEDTLMTNVKSHEDITNLLLTISAENKDTLRELAGLYKDQLRSNKDINFGDFCHTANTAREFLDTRAALYVKDIQDAEKKLEFIKESSLETEYLMPQVFASQENMKKASVALVFPGQGSQYPMMAKGLYDHVPVFKESFDECSRIFEKHYGKSLLEIVFSKQSANLLKQTSITQPAVFSIGYSTANVWMRAGIKPKMILGHSIGEYVAACISGMMGLEDALHIIIKRSSLMQELPMDGGMAVIFASYEEVTSIMERIPKEERNLLTIAAVNGPQNVVVSGKLDILEKFIEITANEGIKNTKLDVSHAFHSPLMEPMIEPFGNALSKVSFSPIKIPVVLNVTGEMLKKGTVDINYLKDHIRNAVLFEKSIKTAVDGGVNIFLEAGSGTTAKSMIKGIIGNREDIKIISTLNRSKEDMAALNEAAGEIFTRGIDLDFNVLDGGCHSKIMLPVCPLLKKKCWIEQYKEPALHEKKTVEAVKENICLNANTNHLLKDHIVKGMHIFPGTGVWEFVARTAAHKFGQMVKSLSSVNHIIPIEVSPGEDKDIELIFEKGRECSFKVVSKDKNTQKNIIHVTGTIVFGEAGASEKLNIAAEKNRLEESKASLDELYEKFLKRDVNYGSRFRSISKMWFGEKSALAMLQDNANTGNEFEGYLFKPGVLDGALQSIVGLSENRKQSDEETYVPFFVKEVNFAGRFPEQCYSLLELTKDSGETISADIKVSDSMGNICMTIMGFSFKKINIKAIQGTVFNKLHAGYYYERAWVKKPLEPLNLKTAGNYVILGCNAGESLDLAGCFRKNGSRVIICSRGKEYSEADSDTVIMDFSQSSQYQSLMNKIDREKINDTHFIYLSNAGNGTEFIDQPDKAISNLEDTLVSLMNLTKTIGDAAAESVYGLSVLVNHGETFCETGSDSPLKEAIRGFIKSAAKEYHSIRFCMIDMSEGEKEEIWEGIRNELANGSVDVSVAYHRKERYIEGYRDIGNLSNQGIKIKKGGTYLVTGGLSGIGLEISKQLSNRYKANLVLVGRTPVPKREDWERYIQNINNDDESRSKISALLQMEANGSKIWAINADVAEFSDMKKLKEKLGSSVKLNGIFHLAGVIRDSFIRNKKTQDLMEVLSPKVKGSTNLVRVFKDTAPEFIMLFSSISSAFGSVGQSDYAAANGFMDGMAAALNDILGTRAVCVNWTMWEGAGMGSRSGQADVKKRSGIVPFELEEGYLALEKALDIGKSNIIALNNSLEDMYQPDRKKNAEEKQINSIKLYDNRILHENSDYKTLMEELLVKRTADLLGVGEDDINKNINFLELGLDSIKLVDFSTWIGEQLNANVYPTLLFEYATVGDLSEFIVSEYEDKVIEIFGESSHTVSQTVMEESNHHEMETEPVFAPIAPIIIKEQTPVIENFIEEPPKRVEQKAESKDTNIAPEQMPKAPFEDIAVIGYAGRFPGASDIDGYWENIKNGKDSITEMDQDRFAGAKDTASKLNRKIFGGFLEDVEYFDPLFFNISPKEAVYMDPQQRLFLETSWLTLDMAGYGSEKLKDKKVGVYVGASQVEYKGLLQNFGEFSPYMGLGNALCVIANRVSYLMDLRGPSFIVDTACSSSLVAIHSACKALINNEADMAIAGGVQLYFSADSFIIFGEAGMLSKDGRCKTFDESADGYVRGEGVGAVLLKPLSKALEDGDNVYAVIKGSAVNHDGNDKVGISAPNPKAQKEVIQDALKRAGIAPEQISYVEAHGTGTSLGDPVEIRGITQAYRKYTDKNAYCAIGSAKTSIGHLEASAGIAALLKVVLMLKNKMLPPSLHFNMPNQHIQFNDSPFYVNDRLRAWEPSVPTRCASVSSFGFGGTNCHIILEEFVGEECEDVREEVPGVFAVSAKSVKALDEILLGMKEYINNNPQIKLQDLCYSLNTGRNAFEHRVCFTADSVSQLADRLEITSVKGAQNASSPFGIFYGNAEKGSDIKPVIFMGNIGPVSKETLKRLIAADSIGVISELDTVIKNITGKELDQYAKSPDSKVSSRLMTFAASYAMVKTLMLMGVKPVQFIAVELMEITSLVLAGILELQTAINLLVEDNYRSGVVKSKNILIVEDTSGAKQKIISSVLGEGKGKVMIAFDYSKSVKDIVSLQSNGEELIVIDTVAGGSSFSHLNAIAKLYARGMNFNWSEYYKKGEYKRIILPAYPFQKKKCWINKFEAASNVRPVEKMESITAVRGNDAEIKNNGEVHERHLPPCGLYAAKWVKKDNGTQTNEGWKKSKNLVFGAQGGVSDAYISCLVNCDVEYVFVEAAEKYIKFSENHIGINPYSEDDYIRLFQDAGINSYSDTTIIHLWGLYEDKIEIETVQKLDTVLSVGLYSIFYLAKAFKNYQGRIEVLFAARNGQHTTKGNEIVWAASHAAKVALLSLSKENSAFKVKCVDLDINCTAESMVEKILKELSCGISEQFVSYVGEERFYREFDIINMEETAHPSTKVKPEVVLITGGASGIGYKLAAYYAEKFCNTLIITGRTILPPEEEWESALRNNSYEERILDKLSRLVELKKTGARIYYIAADVSKPGEMVKLAEKINERFKGLDGLIHCAGSIEDGLAVNKSMESFKRVILPKIFGVLNLEKAMPFKPGAFFVMLSSITSLDGNAGQMDYSSANAFMDYFAGIRNPSVYKVSLSLPYVNDGGMLLSKQNIRHMENRGIYTIDSHDIINFIEKIVETRAFSHAALMKIGEIQDNKETTVSVSTSTVGQPFSQAVAFLRSIFAELLLMKESEVDASTDFSNFGLDSLIIGDAVRKIEDRIGHDIAHSIVMEYTNINKLAAYLIENFGTSFVSDTVATEVHDEKSTRVPEEFKKFECHGSEQIEYNHAEAQTHFAEAKDVKSMRIAILRDIAAGKLDRNSGIKGLLNLGGWVQDV